MLLRHKPNHLRFNTCSFSTDLKPQWRDQIKHAQIVTQIATILTQRNTTHWAPLLKPFNLNSSNFTPPFFLQILRKTQAHPAASLSFFNYAKKNLGFKPDLKTQSKLTHILFGSGLSKQSKPILDSLVQAYPANRIVSSLVKGIDSDVHYSSVLSSLLECYCNKRLYMEALEVYQKAKEYGYLVSIHSCNALLSILLEKNENNKMFWCFYGLIIRDGVSGNLFTWSLIAQALSKDGKFEMIIKILDMGMYSLAMYNLMIEGYSKRGDFKAALSNLNEMHNKGFDPSFSTLSFILDGACEYHEVEVIDEVINFMVGKGFLPKPVPAEYDSVIQKLAHLGKTFAAEFFLRRATEEKIELQGTTYGSILRALSKAGRVKDAINLYDFMAAKKYGIIDNKYFHSFLNVLCEENPSEDVSRLLKDLIERGLSPCVDQMSKYISSQCENRRWKESEEILNVILDKGILPNSICFSSLVKHYCFSRRIDFAISLHTKMEVLDGAFDVTTYAVLLDGLFREKKIEEALRIFDYMRIHNVLSSDSFSIIIRGLCREKNFRKAMSLHDEMLKLGLKPDEKKYKNLISGFK